MVLGRPQTDDTGIHQVRHICFLCCDADDLCEPVVPMPVEISFTLRPGGAGKMLLLQLHISYPRRLGVISPTEKEMVQGLLASRVRAGPSQVCLRQFAHLG